MAYTFVLVHGAWHGGWCWQRVADRLRDGGHVVFTPTLTGLGERAHLLRAGIDLKTHIADVVNVMKWEQLTDVVLCGHSYGGIDHLRRGGANGAGDPLDRFPRRFRAEKRRSRGGPDRAGRARGRRRGAATRRYRHSAAPRGSLRRQRSRSRLGGSPLRRAADRHLYRQDRAHRRASIGLPRKSYIRAASYANPGFDRALAAVKSDPSWRTYASVVRPRRDGRRAGPTH